jgi:hypothetical protein
MVDSVSTHHKSIGLVDKQALNYFHESKGSFGFVISINAI